jgi:RNA polymerase sigma factor (sigma-70 family)
LLNGPRPMGLPGGSGLLPSSGLVLDDSACELGQARAALSGLVENLPALVFVKNAQTLSFELFNGMAEQFLGAPRDAVIGRSDADFFPSDQVKFFAENDRSVLHENKVLEIPREPIDTAEGRKWLHTRKIPVLDGKGNARYLLGISLDVTRHRDAKGALRRLHAELEQRVASLAHARGALGTGSEQAEDPSAGDLKVLHAKYGSAIFAHCKRLLGSSAAAEDAMQEVFVRVLRQTGRRPTAAELRPWLFRIATNYCLNELRNRRLRTRGPLHLATALPNSLENCLIARGQLAHLLERLPPRVRDVARLTYVEGMLQQEVAEALGVSRRTVVSCLSQLRAPPPLGK